MDIRYKITPSKISNYYNVIYDDVSYYETKIQDIDRFIRDKIVCLDFEKLSFINSVRLIHINVEDLIKHAKAFDITTQSEDDTIGVYNISFKKLSAYFTKILGYKCIIVDSCYKRQFIYRKDKDTIKLYLFSDFCDFFSKISDKNKEYIQNYKTINAAIPFFKEVFGKKIANAFEKINMKAYIEKDELTKDTSLVVCISNYIEDILAPLVKQTIDNLNENNLKLSPLVLDDSLPFDYLYGKFNISLKVNKENN